MTISRPPIDMIRQQEKIDYFVAIDYKRFQRSNFNRLFIDVYTCLWTYAFTAYFWPEIGTRQWRLSSDQIKFFFKLCRYKRSITSLASLFPISLLILT